MLSSRTSFVTFACQKTTSHGTIYGNSNGIQMGVLAVSS